MDEKVTKVITLREINNPKELKFGKKTKPTKKKQQLQQQQQQKQTKTTRK